MKDTTVHIQFRNQQNPGSNFDILDLEGLFENRQLDHSPYELHLVSFYMMIIIEDGQGSHTIDFTEYDYTPRTILTIRKDQIHKFHKNNYVKGKLILFEDDFIISYLEKLEALKTLNLFNEILSVPKIQLSQLQFDELIEIVNRMSNEYFTQNDPYSMGIIRSELHILLSKIYRIKYANHDALQNRKYLSEFIELQNLIENRVKELKKVSDYSKILGISSKTINTITRSIIHKSGKEFIDEICLQQIKRMLRNTENSIKEIAYATGFEETTNFYKYFKRLTGQTPESFRHQI